MGAGVDEPELPLTLEVGPCPREVEDAEEEEAAATGLHGASSKALSMQYWAQWQEKGTVRDVAAHFSSGWLRLGSSADASGPGSQGGRQ